MKHPKVVKIICILFVCIFIIGNYTGTQTTSTTIEAATVSDLKSKQDALKQESDQLEAKLKDAEQEKEAMFDKKQVLEQQLINIEGKITNLNSYVKSLEEQIVTLEAEIVVQEERYEEYNEKFRARIRSNYENGDISYLEIFLSSKSFSDLLTRMQYASAVMAYDEYIMENMQEAVTIIKTAKEDVEVAIAENKTAKKELEEEKRNETKKKSEIDNQIQVINANISTYEYQVAQNEAKDAELAKEIKNLLDAEKIYQGNGFIWPVPGHGRVSSGFGYRTFTYNGKVISEFHYAIDIPAPKGTNVVASEDGTVVSAKWVTTGGGNQIVIDHGSLMYTHYNHLSKILVSPGDTVKKGDVIGLVGSTGMSTGNHLDFKIVKDGVPLDPLKYVTPPK